MTDINVDQFLKEYFTAVQNGWTTSFAQLLPLFKIGEDHMSSELHYQLSPFYELEQPQSAVYCCGRQLGKCVSSSTSMIHTANGRPVKASDLKTGDSVLTRTADAGTGIREIKNISDSGVKPLLRIKTRTGSILEVTPDHRLLVDGVYKKAGDIRVGEHLCHLGKGAVFNNKTQPLERVVLTPSLMGSGSIPPDNAPYGPSLAGPPGALMASVEACCVEQGLKHTIRKEGASLVLRVSPLNRAYLESLLEDGLTGSPARIKSLPAWVFDLPKTQTRTFIEHLWAAADSVALPEESESNSIKYCGASRGLVDSLQALLCKFGIPTAIRVRHPGCGGKPCGDVYELKVETQEGLASFLEEFNVPLETPVVMPPTSENHDNPHTYPKQYINPLLASLFPSESYDTHPGNASSGVRDISGGELAELLSAAEPCGLESEGAYKTLKNLLDSPFHWDRVLAVENAGTGAVLDLEIDSDHNFILNGLVSHNSMGFTAQLLLRAHFYRGFHTLVIEPRADQLARYNATILKPMIKHSLLGTELMPSPEMNRFAVKECNSGSLIYLEFSYLSPDRCRGITGVQSICYDEIQDLDYDHLAVINEVMSASRSFGLKQFTGTPKTSDGTLGVLWNDSSMAEWVIPCSHCRKKNIPSLDQDLLKMIGKTLQCAKCGRSLDGRGGYYVHARPELQASYAGYHFSQITHPLHYGLKHKWQILLGKMEGPGAYSKAKFYNEVLGVPCDENVKLLSQADLITASSDYLNKLEDAVHKRNTYEGFVMGVDWSGGGELSESYTSLAVCGFRGGTDVVDCLYAERLPMGMSPEEEAAYLMSEFQRFQCVYMAHDYGGAGYIRESLMRQAGLSDHQIIPYTYVHNTQKDVITYNPPTGSGVRFSYSLDKARSLAVLCAMLRGGKIKLPAYDEESRLVLDDLLNLVEMPRELPHGNTMYLIGKAPKKSDDFAHALNYACSAIWYTRQAYPDISVIQDKFIMTDAQLALASPTDPSKLKW